MRRTGKEGRRKLTRPLLGCVEPAFGLPEHLAWHWRLTRLLQQPRRRRRVGEVHTRLGGRLALQGGGAQRALLVIEAPLHSQRGLQPMARACPWGTLPGLGLDRQAGADRFKRVGGEGAPAVRDDKLWDARAPTGRREAPPCHPTGCRRGDGARPPGARVALAEEHAPPFDARDGTVHLPPIHAPVWMRGHRFLRMGRGGQRGACGASRGDLRLAWPVQSHDPCHRASGNLGSRP